MSKSSKSTRIQFKLPDGPPTSPADEVQSWMSTKLKPEDDKEQHPRKEEHPRTFKHSLLVASGIGLGIDTGESNEQKEEHVTPEDDEIRSQFTAQEIRDLETVFKAFDPEKTG